MEGGAYIAALLRLCRHSSESVIRRALKLITASVAKLKLQEQPDSKVTAPIFGTCFNRAVFQARQSQCCHLW